MIKSMNEIDKLILGYLDRAHTVCDESTGVTDDSEDIVIVAKMIQEEEHWQREQARIVSQEVDSMTIESDFSNILPKSMKDDIKRGYFINDFGQKL